MCLAHEQHGILRIEHFLFITVQPESYGRPREIVAGPRVQDPSEGGVIEIVDEGAETCCY